MTDHGMCHTYYDVLIAFISEGSIDPITDLQLNQPKTAFQVRVKVKAG